MEIQAGPVGKCSMIFYRHIATNTCPTKLTQRTQKNHPEGGGSWVCGVLLVPACTAIGAQAPRGHKCWRPPGNFPELSGSVYLRALGKCSMIFYRHIAKHLPNSKLTQTHRKIRPGGGGSRASCGILLVLVARACHFLVTASTLVT